MTQSSQPGLPSGYHQGFVTAITVFLGFSLSFVRFWNFEAAGVWTLTGIVAAIVVGAGIVVQLVALFRSLGLEDDEPAHYTVTVRFFFARIVVVVVGILIAAIAA